MNNTVIFNKNIIERLEAFEEKCSIRFGNISIRLDGSYTSIFDSLHHEEYTFLFELFSSQDDGTIPRNIRIVIVFYDSENKILFFYNKTLISKDNFWKFSTAKISLNLYSDFAEKVSKIRLYPNFSW